MQMKQLGTEKSLFLTKGARIEQARKAQKPVRTEEDDFEPKHTRNGQTQL